MHSAGCPKNKSDTTYYTVPLAGLQAEIARLKAELEKAERDEANKTLAGGKIALMQHYIDERDDARAELEKAKAERMQTMHLMFHFMRQRDEARQWANKLQDKMFDVLVSLYMSSERPYYAVAELCDEKLDRSGALLGRVREEAMKRGGRNG
jgi:hypothetical protein